MGYYIIGWDVSLLFLLVLIICRIQSSTCSSPLSVVHVLLLKWRAGVVVSSISGIHRMIMALSLPLNVAYSALAPRKVVDLNGHGYSTPRPSSS